MIRSMTGFGRGKYQENGIEFEVEIRSVNHRYSDISVRMPRQLSFLEDSVRDVVGRALSRGKVDVFIQYADRCERGFEIQVDENLAGAYIESLRKLQNRFGIEDQIPISLVAAFPDVLRVEKAELDEEYIWKVLSIALDEALNNLISMREKEGEQLKKSLCEKCVCLKGYLNEIEKRAPEVVIEYKRKLESRIRDLLDQQVVDEARLAAEVAFFADRCSIDEEIVRLKSHIKQLEDAVNLDISIGRKLDFLVQEMNREVNTIGSKANDLAISKYVIEMKSEIEKIREQIQNIE